MNCANTWKKKELEYTPVSKSRGSTHETEGRWSAAHITEKRSRLGEKHFSWQPEENRIRETYGLELAGVRLREDGAVRVNREMHTTAPHVWAAGDVIGEPMLETIAAKEGAVAAENALLGTHRKIDFLPVPRAIFTSPQVATVGLTEKGAHDHGIECACRTVPMAKVPKAIVIRDTRGLIKMVVNASTGRILGVHILAENAADIIHEAVLAVKYRLTIDDIIDTVHVFPTMTESIKLVATSFRKDIDQLSCCAE